MRNPEEAINGVLAGLREAQPPAGMEARILLAMKSRALESHATKRPAHNPWHRACRESFAAWREWNAMRGHTWHLTAGMTLAGAAVAALVVMSMHKPGQNRQIVRDSASFGTPGIAKELAPQPLHPQNTPARFGTAEPAPAITRSSPSIQPPSQLLTRSASESIAMAIAEANPRADAPKTAADFEALALSEMLAPSRPAPPLPVTKQESLLAQVVQKGDPEQIADLKPDVRAKQMEIAKTEFHNFFDPPSLLKDNE